MLELLQLLKDDDQYKARLQELEDIRDEALDAVEAVVGSEEIEAARSRALAERQMAGEELAAAKSDAAKIISQATEAIAADRALVESTRVQTTLRLDTRAAELRSKEDDLESLSVTLAAREQVVREQEAIIRSERTQSAALLKALEDRASKLNTALASVGLS